MATTFLEASCCAHSGLFEKWGAREQSGALLVALWGAAAGPVMQYEEYRLRGHSTTHCVILGKTPGPRCHQKQNPHHQYQWLCWVLRTMRLGSITLPCVQGLHRALASRKHLRPMQRKKSAAAEVLIPHAPGKATSESYPKANWIRPLVSPHHQLNLALLL